MSDDDCCVISSDSTIEISSKKRKRDEDDSPQTKFCCFVCDCEVSGDLAMLTHLNSTEHKANNTLKRKKIRDSTPTTDQPTDSTVVTPEPAATIPTTAKSSISIPDSSTALQSRPAPDSSVNCHRMFHCTVCELDVSYSNDNLSLSKRNLEQQQHSTKHKNGSSSLAQDTTCAFENGQIHRRNVSATGMTDNKRPDLSRPDEALKASATLSTVPKVSLQPVTEDAKFSTGTTLISKVKIEPSKAISHSSTVPKDSLQPVTEDAKVSTGIPLISKVKIEPSKDISPSSTVSKDISELKSRELSEHKQHVLGTIPTTAKSSISTPDSSTTSQSIPLPDSSANCHRLFHCTVCELDVSYSNDNLSTSEQNLEQQRHSTMHRYGLSSSQQEITCTVCKLLLTSDNVSEHEDSKRHCQNIIAMGFKGNESGIFIPALSSSDQRLNDSATLSTSSEVSLQPVIEVSKVTTAITPRSKDKIEPAKEFSASSAVSEDSSDLEYIESTVVPQLTFYCSVCSWKSHGPTILGGHLSGSLHASKVLSLGNAAHNYWVMPAARLAPAILQSLPFRIAELAANDPFVSLTGVTHTTRFHCTLCEVRNIMDRTDLDEHLQSAYHKTKVKALENKDAVEFIDKITCKPPVTPETPTPPATKATSVPPAIRIPPAAPATSSVVEPVIYVKIRGFYCDTCAIYDMDCDMPREHFNSEAHKKTVAAMASEGSLVAIPPRGSEEWVARLPPNVAYCTVCLYAVVHRSMIYEHRRSEPHKKLLAEMGIQFDDDGIPMALPADSDGNIEADVKPCTVDPDVSADWFFGFSVVDNTTEEQGHL